MDPIVQFILEHELAFLDENGEDDDETCSVTSSVPSPPPSPPPGPPVENPPSASEIVIVEPEQDDDQSVNH